jgi:hypothetical protein
MSRLKIAFAVLVALFVTLGLGYAWGSSGKLSLTSALDETKQQLDIAEARGHLLDARVSLYNVNFGDASRQFEEAKAPLRRVHEGRRGEHRDGHRASGGGAAARSQARSDGERQGRAGARRNQGCGGEVTTSRWSRGARR